MINRDEVLNRTDMLELVHAHATHPVKGPDGRGNYMTVCFLPGHVHNNCTPSLSINPKEHVFRCFGSCGASGSTVDMYMLMHNVSFADALSELARKAGVEDSVSPEEKERIDALRERENILTAAMDYYCDCFAKAPIAAKYLESRGISKETAEKHRLGFSNGTLPQGIVEDKLIKVGLAHNYSGKIVPFFKRAIVVPVIKHNRCVYMTARAVAPKEGERKHLHLSLGKGQYMPAWFNEGALRESKMPIMCEAPMDALSWCQIGLSAFGTLGAQNFHERHLAKIPEDNVMIMGFDNDEGGIKATERIGNMLVARCREIPLVLTYPDGCKDANEVLRKMGPNALAECFDTATAYPIWLFRRLWKPNESMVKNVPAIRKTLASVAMCDALMQEALVMDIAKESGVRKEVLEKQLLTFML